MPIKAEARHKLSITHINTTDVVGGAARVAWRLAEWQRNSGHEARMLVGRKRSDSKDSFSFPISISPAVKAQCQQNGWLYYEFEDSHHLVYHPLFRSAVIIHLHNLHGGYFNPFSLLAYSQLKPIVWTLHDMQALTGHCAHSFSCERWNNGCGECPDLSIYPGISVDTTAALWKDKKLIYDYSHLWIVTPSQWLKNKVEQSILKYHQSNLIYNGVDTSVFRPYSKKEMRKKFNLPENMILIGGAAQSGVLANPWKGGAYTLEAIKALKEHMENCAMVNIGVGGESGVPYIINIPPIDDEAELASLYSALDIFLLTSTAENCPLIVLEALACRVPIVTFATGGVPELVRDGLEGFVIGYKDIVSLIKAVIRLAKDSNLRKEFSMNARKRATSNFDHKMIARQYENLYRRCLEDWKIAKDKIRHVPLAEIPEVIKTNSFIKSLHAAQSGLGIPDTEMTGQEVIEVTPQIGFNDLRIGQWLKVKGKPGDDGAFVALRIRMKPPADEAEIEGLIQSIDHQKNTLRLFNREFVLRDDIAVKDLQGNIISLKGLKTGEVVKLKGKYSEPEGFVPEKIKMREAMGFDSEELQGDITKIDPEKKTLEVVGFTVVVNEDTIVF